MTYGEFLNKSDRPQKVLSIISMFYPEQYKAFGTSMKLKKVLAFIEKFKDIEIPTPKPINILDEMVIINRMVKDVNCPKYFKNWFYSKKYSIIKFLMINGHCTKIVKYKPFENNLGSVCLIEIDNKYKFHQIYEHCLINGIPNYIKVENTNEVYTPEESISFDKSRFLNWKLNVLLINLKKIG